MMSVNTSPDSDYIFDFQSAPIPIFLAIIILLPLNSGYSPIHHLVILAGGQSISLANKETMAAADFLDRTALFSVVPAAINTENISLTCCIASCAPTH